MLGLKFFQLVHQRVILCVRDGWRILHVVQMLVVAQFRAQFRGSFVGGRKKVGRRAHGLNYRDRVPCLQREQSRRYCCLVRLGQDASGRSTIELKPWNPLRIFLQEPALRGQD